MMVIAAVGGAALLVLIILYNGLVSKKNEVDNSFASIDVQLKQRYDLIPNLVETVKQYMQHERSVLDQLTSMRAKAMQPGISPNDKIDCDNKISGLLKSVMVSVENYPNLKASDNFSVLQRSMNEVEAQIAAARRAFNSSVTDYNNALEMFPSNILAGMLRYTKKQVFEIQQTERENVNIGKLFK